MYNDGIDEKRFKQICNTLMEFASGHLASRVEESDKNDEIEKLVRAINNTLEKVSSSFHHQGFANHGENYNYNIQLFFLLNNDDSIVSCSPAVKKLLAFNDHELNAKPFPYFLTKESKLDWHQVKSQLEQTPNTSVLLFFKTKQGAVLKMNCLVDKAFGKSGSEGIMVTAIKMEKQSDKVIRELKAKVAIANTNCNKLGVGNEKPKKPPYVPKIDDKEKFAKVCEYLQKNWDRPYPPIKDLVALAGTTEHRLRYGFMQVYGQSPYKYLQAQRLIKAMQLVKNSNISLKIIAIKAGFNDLSNFSIAFKKEFKKPPFDIRYKKQTHNAKGST
ncbi:MAG: helix-turn-helix domain-containing protein [Cellulophaga sp.]